MKISLKIEEKHIEKILGNFGSGFLMMSKYMLGSINNTWEHDRKC
jgi:hypothetical protein